jgi:hypothetical protein
MMKLVEYDRDADRIERSILRGVELKSGQGVEIRLDVIDSGDGMRPRIHLIDVRAGEVEIESIVFLFDEVLSPQHFPSGDSIQMSFLRGADANRKRGNESFWLAMAALLVPRAKVVFEREEAGDGVRCCLLLEGPEMGKPYRDQSLLPWETASAFFNHIDPL